MTNAIEIQQLVKVFPKTNGSFLFPSLFNQEVVVALDKISIEIVEGKIFGILGPNGAGKTTLIKILTTSIIPTKGSASICGIDIIKEELKVKKLIGLVNSDERSFFWRLTGRQNLHFFASLYGLSHQEISRQMDELFELFDLQDKADVRFYNYSTGMKQKLAIARGLINRPRVIFMDEPTRSLDPVSARALRFFIKERIMKTYHCTLVLTTHNLKEAEELCDEVAILHKGKILAKGTIEELRKLYKETHMFQIEVENLSEELLGRLNKIEGVSKCVRLPSTNGSDHLEITVSNSSFPFHYILKEIIDHNGRIRYCTGKEMSLEDIFQSVISHSEKLLHRGAITS